MALTQSTARTQRIDRIERQVDSWVNIGLAVLAGYVLASWVNHVPLLMHKAEEVPVLAHQVVVARGVATKEHAHAVAAEKDRDAAVQALGFTPASSPPPPVEPKPRPPRPD